MNSGIHDRIERAHAAVLIIDLQEKLLAAIPRAGECTAQALRLIKGAELLQVPVLATEQYPQGLGRTAGEVAQALVHSKTIEKLQFSAWTSEVEAAVGERFHIVLAGIEAHVCVQQTALDLLRAGKRVWVCTDACQSRRDSDRELALDRMRQAGAGVTSVESVLFELLGTAAAPEFKQLLKIVK